ncbi:MAG: urea ABC transporter permease subunit UrtB [Rhodobacteraceae bacterium]|jgi:urea transport system permease protein|nr:urea ABC transporter permease subunit UrtB [Paracoccaceae bacterium]
MVRLATILAATLILVAASLSPAPSRAQGTASMADLIAQHGAAIVNGSRRTAEPAIAALAASGLPEARLLLERWQARDLHVRPADGAFFYVTEDGDTLTLTDAITGAAAGTAPKSDLTQLRPGGGIRSLIASALVRFQLSDPDPAVRAGALQSIERDPAEDALAPLRDSIAAETDPALLARKTRLERLLTARFDPDPAARVTAIETFRGDIAQDVRAVLNPIVATRRAVAPGTVPEGTNLARTLDPGTDDLPRAEALALLVAAGAIPAPRSPAEIRAALEANIVDGTVAGIPTATLNTDAAREAAYAALAAQGLVPVDPTTEEEDAALAAHVFYDAYAERDATVTAAAADTLASIRTALGLNQAADLALDGLSLASIYFLAAIGLAITFGVMRVINMAHGEFIMMGAYTGYVVQLFITDYTLSLVVALPLAFAVTFAAGVAMERLVIRHLYHRPLETLLATFGISIALQQLAKVIFGTQARPLTAPSWLDGSWVVNDIVGISYIRIAIFILALVFLGVFLFIMKRTRLGLEVRAVTQNPRMAASMGIDPGRINMLTFGLGSGIAGIAGVAIGLFAQVTSEMGTGYIVQSFMTVVVGGVGNIFGALAGAGLVGFLQKGIEWMNPANTLAAQTFMILFIIIFIQFRPRGIVALKGRAAGD